MRASITPCCISGGSAPGRAYSASKAAARSPCTVVGRTSTPAAGSTPGHHAACHTLRQCWACKGAGPWCAVGQGNSRSVGASGCSARHSQATGWSTASWSPKAMSRRNSSRYAVYQGVGSPLSAAGKRAPSWWVVWGAATGAAHPNWRQRPQPQHHVALAPLPQLHLARAAPAASARPPRPLRPRQLPAPT